MPSTNQDYGVNKFNKNKQRDNEVIKELKKNGWKVIIIWECEVKKSNMESLRNKLLKELQHE